MGEAIVITSGKGGVGKTTTSANIGTALALQGKQVCLLDTDIGLRNLDVVMGLENRIIYDLVDVLEERCKVQQALIRDKRFDCLHLLPAAQTKEKSAVTPEQMEEIVNELKPNYDYLIIDSPAGIEHGFRIAVAGADQAIVVTTPDTSAVRDADRIIGLLEQEDIPSPKLIVNRVRTNTSKDETEEMLDVDDVAATLAIDLLGIVFNDENVLRAANKGEPVATTPNTTASLAYRNIARRILGESVPLLSIEPKKGFLAKVKKIFGIEA
ncbi:septum site-determining protein MinD [Salicibibacter cibarius]|uniref:Septum site-determining protein MinD n=1 Tax=Salicibibacter cibarius TaxID=2743000 RepID=A0A7T6Z504_9BACI|nr:septum site-determining protein MinD [Salicibibacter cibarius]QQK77113.1 septum site-determining protein MinD [Salicibibacter cibarius]